MKTEKKQLLSLEKLTNGQSNEITNGQSNEIKGGYTPLQDHQWNLSNCGSAPRHVDDYR